MKSYTLRPDPERPAADPAQRDRQLAPQDTDRAEELLGGLNPVQAQAARTTEGAVMIIAGPGSGKTRTLTHRIAYLLAAKKAWPSQILALTFTNKAAREMRARVVDLVGDEAKGMWIGTFHSIFSRVLRREADKIGFSRDFTIYDSDDTERMIKEMMSRYGIDPKRVTPRSVRNAISSAKNAMVGPEEYARLAGDPFTEATAKLYTPYQAALRKANAMDFDDLLGMPIRLFEAHPETLKEYQNRWKYLHIDEYQDTNRTQYVLAKMLAAQHHNLCVVGDDAQSIYAFRGADIQNILSFQKDYPSAETFRLEQNYRSTQRIVRLADAVIKGNSAQLDKTLWTDNDEGDPVVLMEALSERDEAQKVERTVRDIRSRTGMAWSEVAVLYRTNAQSRSIEEALRRGGIPYRMVGGTSFYQRKEIKDALGYLRLAVNPSDDASILRVINTPHARRRRQDHRAAPPVRHRAPRLAVASRPGPRGRRALGARRQGRRGLRVLDLALRQQGEHGPGRRAGARDDSGDGALEALPRSEHARGPDAAGEHPRADERRRRVRRRRLGRGAQDAAGVLARGLAGGRRRPAVRRREPGHADDAPRLEGARVQGRVRDRAGGGAVPAREGGPGPDGAGRRAAAVVRRRDPGRGGALPELRPEPLPLRRPAAVGPQPLFG